MPVNELNVEHSAVTQSAVNYSVTAVNKLTRSYVPGNQHLNDQKSGVP